MSNVGYYSHHVVVKTVPSVSVGSVPKGRAHGQGSKRFFECILVISVDSEIGVVADSCSRMVVSHIRCIIARFVNNHLLLSKFASSRILNKLLIIFTRTSASNSSNASSPVVSLVHVIMCSSVRFEIIAHSFPSRILRYTGSCIVKFIQASLEFGEVDGVELSRAFKEGLHVV